MRFLIVSGGETAALAIIAGVFGASYGYTSSQQLVISIILGDNGVPATPALVAAVGSLYSDELVALAGPAAGGGSGVNPLTSLSGTLGAGNTVFTSTFPVNMVFLNGQLMKPTTDYTQSLDGLTVTFVVAPGANDWVAAI